MPAFPGRNKIPMLLLLESRHFDQLFRLMSKLSRLTSRNEAGIEVLDTKAQILSRRVWEILLLLPTNPVNDDLDDDLDNVCLMMILMMILIMDAR